MKTLKVKSILFSLLAMTAVAVFMTSCERESIVEDDIQGWKTSALDDETPSFIPASESESPDLNIDEIINQLNNESADNNTVDDRCPCGVNLINDVTPPNWNGDTNLINLNIQYDIKSGAQVRVFHYLRLANGWAYQGYDTIYSGGYSGGCAEKSVNMSTGQIPDGTICSIARIWTGTSYCSPWDYVFWTH